MRLILHIGMHKTASTTIQRRLKANNPKLQDFGFRYSAKERKTLLKAVRKKNFKPYLVTGITSRRVNKRPIGY